MYQHSFHTKDINNHQFLITGAAGFIGSHLVEYLVKHKAGKLILVDNLSTGNLENIRPFLELDSVEFHEADINDVELMGKLMTDVDFVLHQAALGSVPRSIKDPLATNAANATGFISILEASRKAGVKRLLYASSSSVYGDSVELPKLEDHIGRPKSPYAITKLMDEYYAELYSKMHGMSITGLRYFNIFGPRQNPKGPYAAAIPLFILEALNGAKPVVYGDGEQSRDFTFVENAVQANIKALFSEKNVSGQVFNIACGQRFSLNQVIHSIGLLSEKKLNVQYEPERVGDIRNSQASIEKAKNILGYAPEIQLEEGLRITYSWYAQHKK